MSPDLIFVVKKSSEIYLELWKDLPNFATEIKQQS